MRYRLTHRADLRGRALIATLTYSFARITAGLRMRVEDRRPHGAGWELRLREKGGKQHVIQCHHALAELLHAYICHCRLLVRSARVRCSAFPRVGRLTCYPRSP